MISDGVKYKAILDHIYDCLIIDELKNMVGLCYNCYDEITSEVDLVLCGIKCCLYKLCSRKKYRYVVDNIHYCLNCVKVSVSIDEVVVSESK